MNAKPSDTGELVSVSLKALIDLAKPAANLSLPRLSIRAQQSGGYLSPIKGRGMEFDEARLYQPGDDARAIDWRVTARTGKTHTKLFREEREKPVFISVDNRHAMQFATRGVFKSVQALKLAALVAWAAHYQGDRIGGQVFSEFSCRELKPQNGKLAVLHFLNALVVKDIATDSQLTFAQILSRLAYHARPGSLLYIISDFRGLDTQAENCLLKLSQHCEIVLVFVYDALEKGLPPQGRYRFTDGQTDISIDAGDSAWLNRYRQHYVERLQAIKRIAAKKDMGFIQCSTQDEPIQRLRRPV